MILGLQHQLPSAPASEKETEEWNNLKSGERKALSYFYTKYFNSLYNYGIKISKDSGLIEDCIQDLFIEIWNNREHLSDVHNVKYYLYKSLRRKIIYKLSLLARMPDAGDLEFFELQLSHKSHYISHQIQADVRDKVAQLINMLSAKQKESIFLIYYEELTYEQAAQIMGVKVKTVYNLIHLATSRLRQNKASLSLPSFFSLLL